ncbi:hypothetical protein KR222_006395 [Zaprionus bogoriensis]|nr:hypothetical protein KR222_006395 [Zaprionus bogoriensis]
MEFVDGGSLHKVIHAQEEVDYTISMGIDWLMQAAKGLAYLHAMEPVPVIHRDVKPLNMLVDKSRKVLKICDFGTVRYFQSKMTNCLGTAVYMAPEVYKGENYNSSCDVYSMGITAWQVMSGKVPYYNQKLSQADLIKRIVKGLRPDESELMPGCPAAVTTLMTTCWNDEPNVRPTMQQFVDTLRSC